jgi:hypothetical protein
LILIEAAVFETARKGAQWIVRLFASAGIPLACMMLLQPVLLRVPQRNIPSPPSEDAMESARFLPAEGQN